MSVASFQELLAKETGVEAAVQEVLVGFPPKLLQLPADPQKAQISCLGIEDGETIVVRRHESPRAAADTLNSQGNPTSVMAEPADTVDDESIARALAMSYGDSAAGPGPSAPAWHDDVTIGDETGMPISSEVLPDGTCIVRRYVDSDNSCLFTAVAYAMENNRLRGYDLRQIIATAVATDPTTYNEGVLGKSIPEYQRWILHPQRWGGPIELSILASYYRTQIAAFDIQTTRCDIYGEREGYADRVMVIYDGLHYDALALAPTEQADEDLDVTKFDPHSQYGSVIMAGAKNLVLKLHATCQFTDTSHFKLRCGQCGTGLTGELHAMEHAQVTGHRGFAEYK
ncbi:unnamed protein product [Ostreobium quekettii]|uniref:Ubiquitin thioesterase OTU n=1 Tax=Ostreobium quekettii TaxID=121088 RepID=A0A8S1IMB2_9CHLO|nr:unnamed protein product [Ostreobium quekettii]